MTNIEKLSISLPHDMVADLKEAVERGSHASVSEVVRDALRDWQKRQVVERYERLRPKSLADLKRMVQEGIDSIERGEGIPAEEVFARIKAKYTAMAREQRRQAGPARKAKR